MSVQSFNSGWGPSWFRCGIEFHGVDVKSLHVNIRTLKRMEVSHPSVASGLPFPFLNLLILAHPIPCGSLISVLQFKAKGWSYYYCPPFVLCLSCTIEKWHHLLLVLLSMLASLNMKSSGRSHVAANWKRSSFLTAATYYSAVYRNHSFWGRSTGASSKASQE